MLQRRCRLVSLPYLRLVCLDDDEEMIEKFSGGGLAHHVITNPEVNPEDNPEDNAKLILVSF